MWSHSWFYVWLNSTILFVIICWLSHVWLFATPWTVATRFLCLWDFPSLGDLPVPGIEPMSVVWQADSSPLSHLGSLYYLLVLCLIAQSCLILCDPMDCSLPSSSVPGVSPGKNSGVGCHALLQEMFPTQGLNPGLLHCMWILYHLSHQGIPRILEWVAYPFSRKSSWPRNQTRVLCIAGRFFTS